MRARCRGEKREAGSNGWVMLGGVGKAVVRRDVPLDLVEATVRELIG